MGTAALSVFLVVYILFHYMLARRNPLADWRFLIPALLVTLIGVFSIWIAYQLIYGVSLKQIVEAMYPIHIGYEFDRLTWIINHPYEFAVFVGLPGLRTSSLSLEKILAAPHHHRPQRATNTRGDHDALQTPRAD